MPKILSFFNHKGGVGKTTLAHNLAFALVDLDQKVLVVDADSQMNLTACMYGLSTSTNYSEDNTSKWKTITEENLSIKEYISSVVKGEPNSKKLYAKQDNLYLLRGDINLSDLDFDLLSLFKNRNNFTDEIPGKIQVKLDELYKEYDYVLIDTSPSASSILNAFLVLTSDYLIAPVSPTFFSLQAIDNLSAIFRNWAKILQPFEDVPGFRGINMRMNFLGLVVQMGKRFRSDTKKTQGFTKQTEQWVKDLNYSIQKFTQNSHSKAITKDHFKSVFKGLPSQPQPYIIEKCCHFTDQLRSIAEKAGLPVIKLTQEIIKKDKDYKRVNIDGEGQYAKSFRSIQQSYNGIAKCLLQLKV